MFLHNYFRIPCQKSKTRVDFLSCQNIDFTASQDHFKVFKLSKNNFLSIFSLIANQKQHFPSFFYGKQQLLARLSRISARARVVEICQSATVSLQWLKLGKVWGMNWQTYWRNIIKIIDSLGKEKTEFSLLFCFM